VVSVEEETNPEGSSDYVEKWSKINRRLRSAPDTSQAQSGMHNI
jgi:hypothetical protein